MLYRQKLLFLFLSAPALVVSSGAWSNPIQPLPSSLPSQFETKLKRCVGFLRGINFFGDSKTLTPDLFPYTESLPFSVEAVLNVDHVPDEKKLKVLSEQLLELRKYFEADWENISNRPKMRMFFTLYPDYTRAVFMSYFLESATGQHQVRDLIEIRLLRGELNYWLKPVKTVCFILGTCGFFFGDDTTMGLVFDLMLVTSIVHLVDPSLRRVESGKAFGLVWRSIIEKLHSVINAQAQKNSPPIKLKASPKDESDGELMAQIFSNVMAR